MKDVGIIARRRRAQVVDSEGFFDTVEEEDTPELEDKPRPQVWTKIQFALAALSATPLLFIGGLGGWPWESGSASSAETPLPTGQQHYPVAVSLDRLNIEAPTDALGVDAKTKAPLAPDFDRAGWYEAGPEPGEVGRSVMFGRRSAEGADVFGRLPDARVGDRILVGTVAGTDLTFVVRSVEQFAVEDFPTDRVYGGPEKEAQLRLISATGAYDAKTGYPRNVIVFADLLD